MKNVCIVGYGAIGPIHAAALAKVKNARLYAVCDISKEKNNLAKEMYDVITYTDFDEMLMDKNIDCIHICTPHYLHFNMTKKALINKKSVVCEKPVTMTQDEYDELLMLPGVENVCVVLQNRLNVPVTRLKEIIQSSELGEIKAVKGILTWFRDMKYYNSDGWRGKWDTEGGGVLINQAIHTLDLISYLVDDISSVQAQISNFSLPDIEVEDTVSAYLKFRNGKSGLFYATNAYGVNSVPELEITFENGTAYYKNNKLFLNNECIAENLPTKLGKTYWGNGHESLIKNYYDENIFFSPFDVKNTMYTLFAIYDSAKNNAKSVNVKE